MLATLQNFGACAGIQSVRFGGSFACLIRAVSLPGLIVTGFDEMTDATGKKIRISVGMLHAVMIQIAAMASGYVTPVDSYE